MALVREMLLEPRWDPNELALAKAAVIARHRRQQVATRRRSPAASPTSSTYGPDIDPAARDILGTPQSVAALTMDDLKAFLRDTCRRAPRASASPARSTQAAAMAALGAAGRALDARRVACRPSAARRPPPTGASVYFYDIPDAKQSLLMFAAPAPRRADPDYYPRHVIELHPGRRRVRLAADAGAARGQGLHLRRPFGASGRRTIGRFALTSPVRANVTLEAANWRARSCADYPTTFTPPISP